MISNTNIDIVMSVDIIWGLLWTLETCETLQLTINININTAGGAYKLDMRVLMSGEGIRNHTEGHYGREAGMA